MDKNNPNDFIIPINDIFIDKEIIKNCDAWDRAINDDKFYINNKIARIFPILKNFSNYSKLKIDDTSFSYITIREIADIISKIISHHLLVYNLNPQKITIIDYTSGVGGNVLSFSKFFYCVYAVEICKQRCEYLENNINVYGYKNINIINDCSIKFNNNSMIDINPNVIFIDPPWGGIEYKNNESLLLSLGEMSIEELLIDIVSKFSKFYLNKFNEYNKINYDYDNYNNKLILLKLPKNYDIEHLYNYIKQNNNFVNYNIKTYLYILNKMLIVICELNYI